MADEIYVPVMPSMKGFMAEVIKEASGAAKAGSAAMQKEFGSGGRESGRSAARGVNDGLSRGDIGVNSVKARMAKLAAQMRAIGRTAGRQGAAGINDGLSATDFNRVGSAHGRRYGAGFVSGVRGGLRGVTAAFGVVTASAVMTVKHIGGIATGLKWAARAATLLSGALLGSAAMMNRLAGVGLAKLATWLRVVSALVGRLARDVARATAAFMLLAAAARALGTITRISRLVGMATVGIAALVGVASTAGPALVALAGALATVGSAAGGAAIAGLSALGAAIAGVKLGVFGVADAFKTMGTSSGGSAAKAADNTKEIARAEKSLAKAVEGEKEAQEGVARARDIARKKLRDLDLQLRGAALSEKDAQLALREARADLAKGGFESGLERERAVLQVQEAEQRLAEVQRENADTAQEAATARAKGVEGSDEVVEAQKQLRDATQSTKDAQDALNEARAPKDDPSSGGVDKQAEAMAKLSTNAQAFVNATMGVKPAWDAMQKSVQDNLFDGLDTRVQTLADTWLPKLGTALSTVTAGFNRGAKNAVDWVNSAQGVQIVGTWLTTSSDMAAKFGTALGNLVPGIAAIAAGAGQAFGPMVGDIGAAAKGLSDMLVQAQQSGKIKQFFESAAASVKTTFQNIAAIAGPAISAFMQLGKTSAAGLAPGIRSIGQAIAQATPGLMQMAERLMPALGQALTNVAPLIPSLVHSFSPWATILSIMAPPLASLVSHLGPMGPLLVAGAVAVKGISAAMVVYNGVMAVASVAQGVFVAATGRSTAGLEGNTIALAAHRVATLAGAAASAVFGAALAVAQSPITWIIVAIGALVAALVWFFTKTELGRQIWATAWNGIKAAVSAVWGWLSTTVFPAFKVAISAIGAAAVWLWQNAIQPAWNGIKVAIGVAWTIISGYFTAWWTAIKVVASVVMWLWNNVVAPAFQGIGSVIAWVWNNVIKPAWVGLQIELKAIGAAFEWVWNNVIKPVWDGLGAGISWVVDNVIKPAFSGIKTALKVVGDFFGDVVEGIRTVWDKLKGYVATPINFVINTVWNRGLLPAWNTIVKFLPGLKKMEPLAPVAFSEGGPVPLAKGATRGKDSVHGLLMPDEHVWDVKDVRKSGGQGTQYRMRQMVDAGKPFTWTPSGLAAATSDGGQLPRFADGGAVSAGDKLAPMPGEGGLQDIAKLMGRIISRLWPKGVSSIGGWRPPDGYNEHYSGRALDVMINDAKTGDQVKDFSLANSKKFPIEWTLWKQKEWHPDGRVVPMGDRGSPTQNHMDHDHVFYAPQPANPNVVPDGLITNGFGGPSTAEMLGIIKKRITEIVDKALNPIKEGIARVVGSPPPEWLGIPPKALDASKTEAINAAFDLAGKLGDKLSWAYDEAKKITSSVTSFIKNPFGLLRDQGGFLPTGMSLVRNETGKPEAVLNWDQIDSLRELLAGMSGVGLSDDAFSKQQQKRDDDLKRRHEDQVAALANSPGGVNPATAKALKARQDRETAELSSSAARTSRYRDEGKTLADLPKTAGLEIGKDTADFFGFGQLFDAVSGVVQNATQQASSPATTGTSELSSYSAPGSDAQTAGTQGGSYSAPTYGDGSTVQQSDTALTKMPDLNHQYDPKGGAEQWRGMIEQALKRQGFPVNPAEVNAWVKQIDTESGGDPNIAQQITDVNGTGEAAGVGLGQMIPTTWAAYRDPSLPDNRRDPWAMINAMVRYGHQKYGPGLLGVIGQGHGYDRGGWLPPGITHAINATGKPEAILTAGQWSSIDSMLEELPSAAMFSTVADMASAGMSTLGGSATVDGDGATASGDRGPLVYNENVYTMDVDEMVSKQTREVRRASRSEALIGGWG
ncbi:MULTISPECIES: hypothetical protein [Gordonia]|uniref:hypothetical protein n=1 Tax=Gordonia TaxID=2053 RepID=UPI00257C8D6A|nr:MULTISPECIES: hypothetical protein [Gordonia]